MPLFFWRLTRVLLVVVAPVLSIYLMARVAIQPEIIRRADELLIATADFIRDAVDRFNRHWQNETESNASDPGFLRLVASSEPSEVFLQEGQLEAKGLLNSLPALKHISVYSKEGKRVLAYGPSDREFWTPPPELIQKVLREAKTQSVANLRQPQGEASNFGCLAPIVQEKRVLGALCFEVDGAELQSVLLSRKDKAGPGSFGKIYDENGALIVSAAFSGTTFENETRIDPDIRLHLSGGRGHEIHRKMGSTQEPQVFETRPKDGEEAYRIAFERCRTVPWVVVYQTPLSEFYGPLRWGNLLTLLIGLIAATVAYFAFSPDSRTLDSAKNFRPELGSVLAFLALCGVTFFLRDQIFNLAESEARENGKTLAASCSRQMEEYFRIRMGLLRSLSEELRGTPEVERRFRESARRYGRDFGGTVLLSWQTASSGANASLWVEGEKALELESLRTAITQVTVGAETEMFANTFDFPGGGQGLFLGLQTSPKEKGITLLWANSLGDVFRSSLAGVSGSEYEVTLVRGSQRYPVYPQLSPDLNLEPIRSPVSMPGEGWIIEVRLEESLLSRKYGFVALIVTILGLVLAGGGAGAIYLASTRNASLREASSRDELTGLRNRRAFNELIERETAIAERYSRPLSIFLLDLDHFKEINDSMGHGVGDEVLQSIADTIQKSVRDTDVVFRYGGEEIAAIMAETNLLAAAGIAERVRQSIANTPIRSSMGTVNLTASLGVTSFRTGEMVGDFLTRVDMALYRAKAEGRNRVVTERPPGWEV